MPMTMVTARVDAKRKRDAEEVLRRNGRTYSDVIRDLTDYLAETGELPDFEKRMLELIQERERERKLDLVRYFARRKMVDAEPGLTDDVLLEQERMARFGE
ncbi:type II toxin-antitoxin system RelB/DinJ family antitoxin [Bifidobacterium vespertilionis]|uniref:type II toxin-antitoxin system RelB/DinJ family antitoxin n=1 Tax=Bifidobacterium vespertilionis TaxID=2562524 RepID=UPI001BDBDD94|nr:type II toxin-antitoxin system RelB/DinJ family antitoxin [Bifidobacterium vespertilionis]MBT1178281.1 type II toxin-antitoxin system RelB/DinJ family antitoxin [Bifidobacterium vespertilionis]